MYGFQFNTIGVSDGMSMGTKGMMYSLPSRDARLQVLRLAVMFFAILAFPSLQASTKPSQSAAWGNHRLKNGISAI